MTNTHTPIPTSAELLEKLHKPDSIYAKPSTYDVARDAIAAITHHEQERELILSSLGEHPDSTIDIPQRIGDIRDEGRANFNTAAKHEQTIDEQAEKITALEEASADVVRDAAMLYHAADLAGDDNTTGEQAIKMLRETISDQREQIAALTKERDDLRKAANWFANSDQGRAVPEWIDAVMNPTLAVPQEPRRFQCERCGGTGRLPETNGERCPDCMGEGLLGAMPGQQQEPTP